MINSLIFSVFQMHFSRPTSMFENQRLPRHTIWIYATPIGKVQKWAKRKDE